MLRKNGIMFDEYHDNQVRRLRMAKGISVVDLALAVGKTKEAIYQLEIGVRGPMQRNGTPSQWVEHVCFILEAPFEEVFPRHVCRLPGATKGEAETVFLAELPRGEAAEADPMEVAVTRTALVDALTAILSGVPNARRHAAVTCACVVGGRTLGDVGKDIGCGAERVRQIVAGTLNRLRRPAQARRVRELLGFA